MINHPFFSVITNFYNSEKFISEAIESVIAQTFSDWELILVDDGSIDNSPVIAIEYERKFPGKVHYYEHEDHKNRGTSISRNLGVKHAKGKFITFLDADDIYLPNRLEEHFNILKKNPTVETIFGATQYWYSWNEPGLKLQDHIQTLEIKTGNYNPPALLILLLTKKAAVPCMGEVTVNKEVFNSTGGFEEEFTGMYDDQVLYSKLILNSKVFVDDKSYDMYRQHEASCCHVAAKNNSVFDYECNFLNWLYNYIALNFSNYSKLLRILKRQLLLSSFPEVYWLYGKLNSKKRKFKKAISRL